MFDSLSIVTQKDWVMHKLTLIENARDSLEHAIDHMVGQARWTTTGDYKRIILDLSHASELLFKERLKRIHPSLIFTNVDKYPSPDAHTVSSELALSRLQKIGEVSFFRKDE